MAGQGEDGIIPISRVIFLNKGLNARAADLKQEIIMKLKTWNTSGLSRLSESLLEDVKPALWTIPMATITD